MKRKIVVIGGVAGGMSFATRYRRLNQEDDIIVFEKGPYVSFANCGLPYYISGEINSRARLLVVKEEILKQRFRLDIRVNSEVIAIDTLNQKITYRYQEETKQETYDELIVSTGAKPIQLPIKGIEHIPSFTLRNIPDLDQIMQFIKVNEPKHVVIVGAGFIGIEVAENFSKLGLKVSLIEKALEVLPNLDYEMAAFAKEELLKHHVDLYTNNEIEYITKEEIHLKGKEVLKADLLIMSVGVIPDTTLIQKAGIKTGMKQGIVVNEIFETDAKHVYAIGDAILVKHQLSNQEVTIPLASPANRQGRQLADIMSGLKVTYQGTLGTSIVRVFDTTFAATGLNEKQLKETTYDVIHLLSNHHASYYPGATKIHLKVIFDPKTEQIIGAQAVGEHGVDKRIDVISTAIKGGIKVSDLQELELSYAPPFSSAKDIVNLAGYVAQNKILGISKTYQWHEIEKLKKENVLFLDVRSAMERMAFGSIEPSMHIEIESLSEQYQEIPKNRKIVAYCESGARSYQAELFLRSKGYDVYNLDGSYAIYEKGKEYIPYV